MHFKYGESVLLSIVEFLKNRWSWNEGFNTSMNRVLSIGLFAADWTPFLKDVILDLRFVFFNSLLKLSGKISKENSYIHFVCVCGGGWEALRLGIHI